MENIGKGSPNSLSSTNEPKNDATINLSPTQNVDAVVARIEGGERRNRHSSVDNIRNPLQVVELASGKGNGSKTRSMPMDMRNSILESNFGDPLKRSTGNRVIDHKRKLPEGDDEVTSKEINKLFLPLNDPSTREKKIKVSHIHKIEGDLCNTEKNDVGRVINRFDLNHPPIDEGEEIQGLLEGDNHEIEGDKYSSNGVANETAVGTSSGMMRSGEKQPPFVVNRNEAKHPPFQENLVFTIGTSDTDSESSFMDENDDNAGHNDNAGDATKTFKFDLNELPAADEDADDSA